MRHLYQSNLPVVVILYIKKIKLLLEFLQKYVRGGRIKQVDEGEKGLTKDLKFISLFFPLLFAHLSF